LTSNDIKTTYVVTANFENIGGLKPRAPVKSAGVNVGIILTANQKTVIGSDFLDVEMEGEGGDVDIKKDIKSLNLAPFLGVEYMLENGLFFDARYSLGVSNLSNDNSGGSVKNSFAQVGVGFKFGGN
ncbi:MlaD family protein, partial [Chryseobacterium cucumeris]|uniref:MlaD family protein n=1 Tax=Chryseobacterium cucumeris TaxID=1813611 RepID=UPI0023F13F5F